MDDGSCTENGTRFEITEAAHHGNERTTLLGVLQRQRDLVAWKLADATDEVLTSVATPTGMSLHGLVRHLTNVERSWLRDVFAGEQHLEYDWTEQDPEAEWRVPAGTAMVELLADFYASVLGMRRVFETPGASIVALTDGTSFVTMMRTADYVAQTWPEPGQLQQMHLDVSVTDLPGAVLRAVTLGAREPDHQPMPEVFRFLLDPAGHPFCLTTVRASRRRREC